MALFTSKKGDLLARARKRDWRTVDEMRAVFAEIAKEDLKIPDVLWMLSDVDPMVRQQGVTFIETFQMQGTVQAIMKELKDASGPARSYLISVLPRIKDDSVFPYLEKMLSGKDAVDRDQALEIIFQFPVGRVQSQMIALLKHEVGEVRLRALQRLLSDKTEGGVPAAVQQAVRGLIEDADERIRIRCVRFIAEHPDPASVDLLIDRLSKDEYAVKTAIISEFEKMMANKSLGMVDRLLPLLAHGDDLVRSTALNLTLKYHNPTEVIRKIMLLSQELMGWMRERIMHSMIEIGQEAMKPIAELLEHPDEKVRGQALLFAINFDEKMFVRPVLRMLGEGDWWTKIIALDFVGRLGDESSVDAILPCLKDEEVKWSGVEALARIGSPKALGPIAMLLGDKTADVRLGVIKALESYNNPKVLPLLKRSLEQDPEIQVRERALEAFKTISVKNQQAYDEKELRAAFGYGKSDRAADKLLIETRRVSASDLHITPNAVPTLRLNGELKKVGNRPFTPDETEKMLLEVLTTKQRAVFDEHNQLDFCYVIPGVGRYRANMYRERLGVAAVFRVIPNELPTYLDTRLPQHLQDIVNFHQGLIVIAGTAGSGKSTTLAALVNLFNERKCAHVLTLEDPIEFVHPFKKSLVNQREIGKHSDSFASALRAALREDPDCIVVGELRDQETMELAMTAAETGHLVVATMHTTSATKTVDRLVEAFPPSQQAAIRMMLSESLKVVINQSLIRRADKKGRIAFHEILMVTGSVRNLIRDNKNNMIPSLMMIGKEHGMQTVDMALKDLVEQGLVSPEDAYLRAERKDVFEPLVSKEFLEGQGA